MSVDTRTVTLKEAEARIPEPIQKRPVFLGDPWVLAKVNFLKESAMVASWARSAGGMSSGTYGAPPTFRGRFDPESPGQWYGFTEDQ